MNTNFYRTCCDLRGGLICLTLSLVGCSQSNDANSLESPPDSSAIVSPTVSSGSTVEGDASSNAAVEVAPPIPATSSAPAKAKREPIYIEESNGQELIAAALNIAQRDHKHVLVEWGGNWCGWCYKLHDVFHNDPEVQPIIQEEFVLVLIDSGPNKEFMLKYCDNVTGYPHLTVLDEQGTVLTNQETGSLEEGPKHDPKLVSAFLRKWTPQKSN